MKLRTTWITLGLAAGSTGLLLASTPQPQEEKRDPKKIFDRFKRKFDTNLDGRISEAEFGGRKRAWSRLDVNGDGWVTVEDMVARAEREAQRESGKKGGKKRRDASEAETGTEAGEMAGDAMSGDMMSSGSAAPVPTADQVKFFETRVRPVLANECFSCHSSSGRTKGGLALDTRAGFLHGGASGPAMIPGDIDGSAFIEAIRYDDPFLSMPPKNKLSAEEVADLESWVRMGAPWPDAGPTEMIEVSRGSADEVDDHESLNRDIDLEAGREFWSFRPVDRVAPPAREDDDWSRSDIDRFLMHSMAEAGVEPVDDATDRAWLRRVTFDLTGLPPSLEEIADYEADRTEDRDAHVVDRLLASVAYAERWGRHWLDVARYAESSGKERNILYPHAWRYRDWVLEAFRQDMPYNEFLKTQLAGDLLPASDDHERAQNQIATGYLALGAKGHANRDRVRFQLDMVDEQIDAMSQGMLGLTLSCARCHDHKFDPIPTEDYYSLAGIFLSTDTHFGTFKSGGNNQPSDLLELPMGANVPNGPTMSPYLLRNLDRGMDKMADTMEEQKAMKDAGTLTADQLAAFRRRQRQDQMGLMEDLLSRFDENGRAMPSNRLAMGVSEGAARDIAVLERGELDRPGDVVRRGIPQVFRTGDQDGIESGSGRAELSEWIGSADNPLTARVWANRIWLHMFGAGLVPTPDNFGAGGQAPTHPELLDWLASELVAQGWSTKAVIREVALTRAYRLGATGHRKNEAVDPDVALLWRMPERRMESEALRDAMLVIAGKLSPERPIGSPLGTYEGGLRNEQIVSLLMREQPVRSVYLPSPRGQVMGTLEAFDAPDSEFVTGDRDETIVATQALFMMNDGEVLRLADAFADRLLALPGNNRDRISAGFEMAYGRKPTSKEASVVSSFLRDYARAAKRETGVNDEEASRGDAGQGRSQGERRRERRRRKQREREQERAAIFGADPEPIQNPERAAWSAFAQSLFQSAEFRVIG